MTQKNFAGTLQRTFQAAFLHEMETNYGFLHSRRMLTLLAEDIQRLIDEFYPAPQYLRPGWILFTGTKAEGHKAHPGQLACEFTTVTISWPLLLQEDIETMSTLSYDKSQRRQLLIRRAIRLLEHGYTHPDGPVLLTLADLALLLGVSPVFASSLLKEARLTSGKPLLTKGYFFDQGAKPTHKTEIIALYEQGLDELEIARRSQHDPSSVGHYLRDYERVKELVKIAIAPARIPALLGMQPALVDAYINLLRQFRPALFATSRLEA